MLTEQEAERNREWGQKVAQQAPEWTPEELAALRAALRQSASLTPVVKP